MSYRWAEDKQLESFHKNLLAAAVQSNAPLRQRVAIRVLGRFPNLLERVHEECCKLVEDEFEENPEEFSASYPTAVKYNGDSYGIDWNGLTNFFKEILPIILPLILKLLTGV